MATIPSFVSILLEVHQCLGLTLESEKDKRKLARLEKSFADHVKIISDLLDEVFTALGMDDHAKENAARNLLEDFGKFNSAIEQSTWTFDADTRQVLWFLAGYSYAPGLGRLVANWNLPEPLDKGMPGGSFWFLPEIRDPNDVKQLVMPLTQVLDWLMDILGQPIGQFDQLAKTLGGKEVNDADGKTAKDVIHSIKLCLDGWWKGSGLRVDSIERFFAEGIVLDFNGALVLDDSLNPEQKFQAALELAKRKKLGTDSLRNQIPMTEPGRMEAIFDGSASNDEKERFVELLAVRYAPPSMRTIRQRLLIARATQDGYLRLGKFLLGKDFDATCPDPSSNKVLQLFMIFRASYTLTVAAHNHCGNNEVEENAFFESKFAPWEVELFLSVLPSRRTTAAIELSEILGRRFSELKTGDPLEDHIGHDKTSIPKIIKRNLARFLRESEVQSEIQETVKQLSAKPHWSRFQEISSYLVANEIALHPELSLKVRRLAVVRMRELAQTPSERIGAISIELDQLLNNEDRLHRGKDAKARVAKLLEEAKDNSVNNARHANILNFEAKHHLAFNDFVAALRLFDEALDACHERGFGRLRGEIARNAFALVVERPPNGFNLGNYDRYYRNMLAYGGFEGGLTGTPPTLEDTACKVSEYFWDNLYYPYFGEENEQPFAKEQAERLLADTFELIDKGDWSGLQTWLKKNSDLRDKKLREVRGHTALMSWIKMLQRFENIQPHLSAMLPDLSDDLKKMASHLQNWRSAICLMINAWPKLINMADFKKQTPLMMAANHADLVIVRKLLQAGSDATLQDFNGRTALHAAIAARSIDCVTELLTYTPDVANIKALEGQTALHTAIRVGHPAIVAMLIQKAPELTTCVNEHNQTALNLANSLLAPDMMQFHLQHMKGEGRGVGSFDDYQEIVKILGN